MCVCASSCTEITFLTFILAFHFSFTVYFFVNLNLEIFQAASQNVNETY